MRLHSFQQKIIDQVINSFRQGKSRILVQSPTGSGKSHIIKYFADNCQKTCAIITHRKELKKMFEGKVNIDVHMVETFKRRGFEYPDLLLLDEAHLTFFDKIIENAPRKCTIIGFTATPLRTGKQRSLSDFYDDIIQGLSTQELINQGFLVPTVNYGYQGIKWDNAKKTAGDYDLSYQSDIFEKRRVFEGVAKNYKRITPDTKAIVFTPNIESSNSLAKHLRDEELPAYSIDSTMPKDVIEELIDKFKNSKSDILVNCSLLTTGFDCPDIKTVILYRATTSRPLYCQMIGRGVRTSENKSQCNVLDFGENIKRFGFWEDDFEWSLDKKTSNKETLAPIRLCPKCDRMNKIQNDKCEHCGFVFPKKIINSEEAELELLVKKPRIGYYLRQVFTVAEAKKIIKDYGYKSGWWHMNKSRYPHIK
jgi:superfamily II DNA or RNA helicase